MLKIYIVRHATAQDKGLPLPDFEEKEALRAKFSGHLRDEPAYLVQPIRSAIQGLPRLKRQRPRYFRAFHIG